jgi:SAM-dependent methyltransferase
LAEPHLDIAYTDPRLVALYDRDNPRGEDTDFYLDLARGTDAQTIIDLGCGTGTLTIELASEGRTVIGVDPSAAMLAVARSKPGAKRVTWINGDATVLERLDADLAVMTGNVAQVFIEDDEWAETLQHIHAALRPGGYLAFESRNLDDRAWERWTREATYERIDSPNGPMECWLDVTNVEPGLVHLEGHNVFTQTGEDLVAPSTLRFRTLAEIQNSLTDASFTVQHVYGDWHRRSFESASRLMVFNAWRG